MPTFPSHWAGVSGTIEANETPYEAAQRELREETNISQTIEAQGGLYVDVPFLSKRTQQEQIIRVYPFVVHVPDQIQVELRGTEHDRYKLVTVSELESMQHQCVPGLVQAFHHATYGKYDTSIGEDIRAWASDKENGASIMTKKALSLVDGEANRAKQISMLRPSMVPIIGIMRELIQNGGKPVDKVAESFKTALEECVALGRQELETLRATKKEPLVISTFSRSGTLQQILQPLAEDNHIVCGQSTPGNEGELMAKDLSTKWLPDTDLKALLTSGTVDVLLIGSDCVLPSHIVNKIGTQELCRIAQQHQIPVYCCADRWKCWDDTFPPPLETDLFEMVPRDLVTKLLVPVS